MTIRVEQQQQSRQRDKLRNKKMMFSLCKNRQGSLMVEALVAISVSVIGFLGVFDLLSRSLAINKDINQKFVATYLAAEGIEIVKSLIDTNYANGRSWNGGLSDGFWEAAYDASSLTPQNQPSFLYFDPITGIYNYDTSKNQTLFQRTISIQNDPQGRWIKVISRVQWNERGTRKEIKLEDRFFDWRF
jgi:hypothetical protein